ncbi:MAG: DEAD/DEAH box helicase [Actinomycetes bacterium]
MDTSPSFADLGLPTPLVETLASQGILSPFPIQQATIADALSGRDTLGRGRTGSGKTLAFSLPLIARLMESGKRREPFAPRAVILVPTRELANQVRDVIAPLAESVGMRTATVYGGVGYGGQITAMRNGVDIVVACPGRFIDLMESGHVDLDAVEVTVLDEADHMAELGFLEHVTRILEKTPREGQRLLFSATLDRGIDKVVKKFLQNPITHEVESTEENEASMTHYFFQVTQAERFNVISDLCAAPGRTLVFTRTKHGARKLTEALVKAGIPSVELHGDLSQNVRARNLAALSSGKVDTLVATDVAARGIHVDDIAIVIHADPPEEHKAFLHRSGRTARAGAQGTVITMVTENMRRQVKRLARDAGIDPITKNVSMGDDILTEVAPGERAFREMPNLEERRPQGGRNGGGRGGYGGGRSGGKSYGGGRSGGGRNFRDRDDRAPREDRGDRAPRSDDRGDRAPRGDDRGGFRGRDDRAPRSEFRGRDDRAPRSEDRGGFRGRDDRAPRSDDRGDRAPRGEDRGGFRGRDDRAPRGEFRGRDDRAPRSDDRGGFRGRDDRAPRGDRSSSGRPGARDARPGSRDSRPGGARPGARDGRPSSGAPGKKRAARSY